MTNLIPLLKVKLIAFISAVILFLAPIHVLILLIWCFVVLDTFAGRWCARKQAIKRGKNVRLTVTSKKTRKGFVSKIISYSIAVILLFVIDDYILNDLIKFFWVNFPIDYIITKGIGLIMVAIELDSIDEKYYLVYGIKLKDIVKGRIKILKNIVLGVKNIKKDLDK